MPTFNYTAIDPSSGKEMKGTMEGASQSQAAAALKSRGLVLTGFAAGAEPAVKGKAAKKEAAKPAAGGKKKAGFAFGRAINVAGITVFTRQLSTLVNAGMPIVRSLETLARQEKNLRFKAVLEAIADSINSGGTFSDGLLQHPKLFDRLYVNMIKAGEAGGVLGTVLERLSKFMEKSEKIKGKVKSAMTYPVIIACVAIGIITILMIFVIPQFKNIFSTMMPKGTQMPTLTQIVISVSEFMQHQFLIALGLLVVLFIAFRLFAATPFGTKIIHWLQIKAPGVGPLMLKASIGRFTRTLGTLLASGVPILQAITITRDTSGNVHVAHALDLVHDRVKEGDNIAKPLEATKVFPNMVSSMIEVGEETGALPDMLSRIADTYDDEVDNAVGALTSIIEPIMIVIMAVVAGTIVIALFLPIIKIMQSMSSGGGG
jgi:type IV pilus assembly protein PilC